MVTVKREVPVEWEPEDQSNSKQAATTLTAAPQPHPAAALEPRQEDYEYSFQAFILAHERGRTDVNDEWKLQFELHTQKAAELQNAQAEEARRNPSHASDYQIQLMLLEQQSRKRLASQKNHMPSAAALSSWPHPAAGSSKSKPPEFIAQKVALDSWLIRDPLPFQDPSFTNFGNRDIIHYHENMISRESEMRAQLARYPSSVTKPEVLDARQAYQNEFERIVRLNIARSPLYDRMITIDQQMGKLYPNIVPPGQNLVSAEENYVLHYYQRSLAIPEYEARHRITTTQQENTPASSSGYSPTPSTRSPTPPSVISVQWPAVPTAGSNVIAGYAAALRQLESSQNNTVAVKIEEDDAVCQIGEQMPQPIEIRPLVIRGKRQKSENLYDA